MLTKMNANSDSHLFLPPPIPISPLAGGAAGGFLLTPRHRGESPLFADGSSILSMLRNGVLRDIHIMAGLVAVQVASGAYMVFVAPILASGLNPLFLVAFGSLATSAFIFPFAFAFEKHKWPSRLTVGLMIRFLLIGLGGVTSFQALMLIGVKKTSPAIASAIPNLAPGIIFVIATCLRFETVDMKCLYSRAKILGTLVCLGGAVTMSLQQSPSVPPANTFSYALIRSGSGFLHGTDNNDWFIGCACLLTAVLVLSCTTVLQAATMIDFEAPFTLCSITSVIGAILTAVAQILVEGKLDIGTPVVEPASIITIVIMGAVVGSACFAFQTWAVKTKGPVLVSMFSPIQTVCSTILSAIFLGHVIKLTSIGGMLLMFFGLYMVLWAKMKEGFLLTSTDGSGDHQLEEDIEKPLLS